MKQSLERESSWAKLDVNDSPINKRGAMKALPTLDENRSNKSIGRMDEAAGFQSTSQVTPTPQDSESKKGRREHMKKMSSWACLGFDDLDLDGLCA
ncbi:unnamed protein product [Cylindrotheca closterium]|uniref:Uncharacterized protein n=1 Tax=Cylindrotheca closterium TaxID=2856 RepID=A0AAD2FNS3_9STRA|nr:unnamed protein product [Cylindrotheca closterium]